MLVLVADKEEFKWIRDGGYNPLSFSADIVEKIHYASENYINSNNLVTIPLEKKQNINIAFYWSVLGYSWHCDEKGNIL